VKKKIYIIIISTLFSIIIWVSISLSNEYYSTFDIPVKVVNFPEGYTSSSNLSEKISVKLKGQGWKLIAVNLSSDADYVISAGNDSGKISLDLYNYLAENQWLSSDIEVIDIIPDTLTFNVEKTSSARVKIYPDLRLDFKPGYGLASEIQVIPGSTIVHGPISEMESRIASDGISTSELNLKNLDSKITQQVSLKELPGMRYDINFVNVILDVQKIVDKNFADLSVEIIDVPRDRDVVLLPNKVSIGIRGGIDILAKTYPDEINTYIYYRDVVLDTLGSITPQLDLPDNVTLLYIKPERLRYIIKKFN